MNTEFKIPQPVCIFKKVQEDGTSRLEVYEGSPENYTQFLQDLNDLNNKKGE